MLATCNPLGVGKWRDEYSESIADRNIVVLADNDPAVDERGKAHYKGQKHATAVASSLLTHGCQIRIVIAPTGKDVSDWINRGGTIEELHQLVSTQPALTEESHKLWAAQWSAVANGNDWPDPLPMPSELPPVHSFAEDLLPISFRAFIRDVADRMQVPIDYPAVITVLALAGAVNRRAVIQPKKSDTGWTVVPNLWGGIIAPPDYLKTPVIQSAVRPLAEIQQDWRVRLNSAQEQYIRDKEEYELRCSAWREDYKKCTKSKRPTPDRPGDPPAEPVLKRLIINDATLRRCAKP